jgi:hypothetical protein
MVSSLGKPGALPYVGIMNDICVLLKHYLQFLQDCPKAAQIGHFRGFMPIILLLIMQPWEWACINLGKAAIIALPSINNEKGNNEYSASGQ